MRFIKENSGPCAICPSASPRTPSKLNEVNGASDSSVEPMNLPGVHKDPTQSLSSNKIPVTSPVPNVIVIWSRSPSGFTWDPSASMSTAVVEVFRSYRRCIMQAALWHSVEGTTKLPLPVSNTTVNSCGGVPTASFPKYAVLCACFVASDCRNSCRLCVPVVSSSTCTRSDRPRSWSSDRSACSAQVGPGAPRPTVALLAAARVRVQVSPFMACRNEEKFGMRWSTGGSPYVVQVRRRPSVRQDS
mmetsp:Transcript_26242/g.59380  ORF Transcript_26242/g.59380 Transcript_26242/m.59380 type:complete len:245 (-) Transcript_26242:21-755(-)